MATKTLDDSDVYKTYACFSSRPPKLPVWSKNKDDNFVVQDGELYCRYPNGNSGLLCCQTCRFVSHAGLKSHIKRHHDRTKVHMHKSVSKPRLKGDALIAYYANLLATIGVKPVTTSPSEGSKPMESANKAALVAAGSELQVDDAEAELSDEGDDVDDDDDDDDDTNWDVPDDYENQEKDEVDEEEDIAPVIHPVPASTRFSAGKRAKKASAAEEAKVPEPVEWKTVSSESSDNTLVLAILEAQKKATRNQLR